jgi:peptide/nickel transport system substrate-binding protein
MSVKRREMLKASAATGLVVLGGAACASAPSGQVSPAPASAVATPRRGGTLVVGLTADPAAGSLNISSDSPTRYAFSTSIHSSLVQIGLDRVPKPDLAESWTVSPDEKTYTFKLRANAMWHDGKPVTSADVKYTIEEVTAKYYGLFRTYAPNIERIDTPDAKTVVFVLKQPIAVLLLLLTRQNSAILPKHIYEGSDPRTNADNRAPVGSGPFKFQEWVKGDHVTLVRNENFYIPDQPYLDRLIFRIIPDAGARSIAFQKGETDLLGNATYPIAQGKQLIAMNGVYLDERGTPASSWVYVNTSKKPLDDVNVRQALAMAIDRNAVAERAYFGFGARAAVSHIEAKHAPHHDPTVKLPAFDAAAANRLLDTAGFPKGADGRRFSLRLAYDPAFTAGHDVVRDGLDSIGIRVELTPYDVATLTKNVFADANFDLMTAQSGADDPALTLTRMASAAIGTYYGNGSRYRNTEVDQLLQEAAATANVDRRKAAYAKVQAILARDLPTIPMVDITSTDLYGPKVRGYDTAPLGRPFYKWEGIWRTE